MLFPLYDHNPHRRFPWLTLLLIVANVVVMWQVSQLTPARQTELILQRGFIPQRLTRIDQPRPLVIRQVVPPAPFQRNAPQQVIEVRLPNQASAVYATLFTTQFLHGGWLPLIFYMWMLWVFGNNVEDRLGPLVFAMFYLVGGVVAAVSHWAFDPASELPVVGASGAVAAVVGGYAFTYPWVKVRTLLFIGIPLVLDIPALLVIGILIILQTFAGIMQLQLGPMANVAHWAHIGGFVAGVVLMPLLAIGKEPPDEDWQEETNSTFDFELPER